MAVHGLAGISVVSISVPVSVPAIRRCPSTIAAAPS